MCVCGMDWDGEGTEQRIQKMNTYNTFTVYMDLCTFIQHFSVLFWPLCVIQSSSMKVCGVRLAARPFCALDGFQFVSLAEILYIILVGCIYMCVC